MKLSRFWVFLLLVALAIPTFVFSQSNSGWNTQTTTATFGFGSQKFNSQLASVFKVQVPFPVYVSGKITIVVAPWWLLVLVFMIFYPIIDIITGFVPPFSKAAEMGSKGVERSKTVFTIGFSVLAMFVTPLVPYVVQLVTVGTTMGVWWFWMLLFMMFIWGVNWLFGESPFGDPFRKGAAGLGHIGSSGITKLRKHWGKEMSDTTNEGVYLQNINNILGTKARIGYKEEELIKILRSLLSEVVRTSSANSVRTRDALDAMLKRAEELKAYFQKEKMIDADINKTLSGLIKINTAIDTFKTDIDKIKGQLEALARKFGLDVYKAMNSTSISKLHSKTFNSVIHSLRNKIDTDTSFDQNQAQLSKLIQELNQRSSKATDDEINMIDSIIITIKNILSNKITPHTIKKFIPFCSNLLDQLELLEKNDTVLMRRSNILLHEYNNFYNNEISKNGVIANGIDSLKKGYKDCVSQNKFA